MVVGVEPLRVEEWVEGMGVEPRDILILGARSLLGTAHGKTDPVSVETTGKSMDTSSLWLVLEPGRGKKLGGGGVLCTASCEKELQNSLPLFVLLCRREKTPKSPLTGCVLLSSSSCELSSTSGMPCSASVRASRVGEDCVVD